MMQQRRLKEILTIAAALTLNAGLTSGCSPATGGIAGPSAGGAGGASSGGAAGASGAQAGGAAGSSAGGMFSSGGTGGLSIGVGGAPAVQPVDVMATADNAYGFGWGDVSHVATYIANPPSVTAGDIFNCPVGGPARQGPTLQPGTTTGPEAYEVPAAQAPVTAYLYLVAWADFSTTQGVIAQFNRQGADPIYTGTGPWQVCATGMPYDTSGATADGPSQTVINQQIAKCNAGGNDPSTTSAGWVDVNGAVTSRAVGKLVFGQDNSSTTDLRGTPGYDFPPTCGAPGRTDPNNGGIDPRARWMWYAPPGFSGDAFEADGTNFTRSFLIFRLAAAALRPPS